MVFRRCCRRLVHHWLPTRRSGAGKTFHNTQPAVASLQYRTRRINPRLVRGEDSYDKYEISLTLKNNSDKDIKFIDATVQFADLLGSHVYDITFNPDHLIPAGQSITDTGQYPINQLMPEQARLAQMKK